MRRLRLLPPVARATYRVLMLAYPASFRRACGQELPNVFAQACEDSRATAGFAGVARRFARAFLDVPRHGLGERFSPSPAGGPRSERLTASEWFSGVVADLRYARRSLVSRPGLTLAVVVTLALGIGANTAIFSVIDATLLARSPWRDADRLVYLEVRLQAIGATISPTIDDLQRWGKQLDVFERLEASAEGLAVLTHVDGARRVSVTAATAGYLGALGVRPVIGRFLTTDDNLAGAPPVVILPESLWRRLFRADDEIIGQEIELDGEPHAVIGVAPTVRGLADAAFTALPQTGPEIRQMRAHGLAWLRPGVSLPEARAKFEASARGADDTLGEYVGVMTPQRNVFWDLEDFRTALLALFGSVFLVLTIACVNVANLLLTSLGRRRGEFAVRAAIGASGARLARLVLGESALLATLGGVLGVVVAHGAVAAMRLVRPGGELGTGLDAVRLDARVLAYAIALSALTAVLFGAVPALRRAASEPAEALQAAALGRGSSRSRLRGVLVAAETALALVLLVGAALMFESFLGLRFADPGFDADRVMSIGVGLPAANYPDPASQTAMLDALAGEIKRVSGVEGVQFGQGAAPPNNLATGGELIIQGAEPRSYPETWVSLSAVQTGFFEFTGIPLLTGRDFVAADMESGETALERAVVINTAMAEKYWPEGDALGASFRFDRGRDSKWNVVVGVAAGIPHRGLEAREDAPHLYRPLDPDPRYMELLVRLAEGVPPPLAKIRAVFARLDPRLPTEDLETSANRLTDGLSGPRFRAALFGAFGVVAIALAVIGIFGVVAHSAAQRRREMAIRLALGAGPRRVLRLVVRQSMTPVLVGLLVGTGASLVLGRLIASLLHGVTPADVSVYASTLVGFLVVAGLATWIPARRATAVDVMETLRAE